MKFLKSYVESLSWFVARMWWLPFSTDELLTFIVQKIVPFIARDLKVYSHDLFYHVLVCFLCYGWLLSSMHV